MERNDFPAGDPGQGSTGGPGAGGGIGNTGNTVGTQGFGGGSTQSKLADVGATVRERAGHVKDSLADALESGADKLRQRVHTDQGGQLAGATSAGTVTTADGKLVTAGDKVASGMEATANWVRDADLDSLKTGIERQVKEHPGRTLLIAVGLGYVLGKAFKK